MTKLHASALCGTILLSLAGCMEMPSGSANDGLIGTEAQFDSMTQPCIAQASRLTGQPKGAIAITDRLPTGAGPILTLTAAGAPYTCRLEEDGSVTVFSEYAN